MPISNIITPENMEEALELLGNGGLIVSGGQALLPEIRQGNYHKTSIDLINISKLTELGSDFEVNNNILSLGARITIGELIQNQDILANAKLLIEAGYSLGDPQIRNSATLGGNLCWGEPRANFLIALIAASTTIKYIDKSLKIERIPLKTLYEQKISHGIRDFILLSAEISLKNTTDSSYQEFSRQKNDLAIVNLAIVKQDNLISGCIGGLFNLPFKFEGVEKSKLVSDVMLLAETAKLTKMNSQFADFDHRLSILKSILNKMSRAH